MLGEGITILQKENDTSQYMPLEASINIQKSNWQNLKEISLYIPEFQVEQTKQK